MDSRKVQEGFHSGEVHHTFSANALLTNAMRLVYVILGIWALYHAMHTFVISSKVVAYFFLLFALWRLYRQGSPLVFLCERGLVVRRRPLTPREFVEAFCDDDYFYIFIAYDRIVGFAEQWESLHIGDPEAGGIYVVPVDLQYLNIGDKEFILEYVEERQNLLET